jgi:hypothetical protein
MGTVFAIVFIILFVTVIALTCGGDEEEKEEKPIVVEEHKKGVEITMPLSYEEFVEKPTVVEEVEERKKTIKPLSDEELKEKLLYAFDKWQETSNQVMHLCAKICCLYYAIDCEEEFFTFDEIWGDYLQSGGEDDVDAKEVMHEALLEIVSDGYLDYNGKKHIYKPTFFA